MFSRSSRRPQANGIHNNATFVVKRRTKAKGGEARERKTKERLKLFTCFRRFVKRGRFHILTFFSFFSQFFRFIQATAPILTVAPVKRESRKGSANATFCRAETRFFPTPERAGRKVDDEKVVKKSSPSRKSLTEAAEIFFSKIAKVGKKTKKIPRRYLKGRAVAGITVIDESRFLWRNGDFDDFGGFIEKADKTVSPLNNAERRWPRNLLAT